MKYLRVKDLIEKLQEFDGDLPVIFTKDGPGHHYGIKDEDIGITDYVYFGNDPEAEEAFVPYDEEKDDKIPQYFLNLGYF